MKNVSFLFFLLATHATSFCNSGSYNSVITEKVVKYNFNPEKTIKIKAEVGQNIQLIQSDIDKIKKLKIHHIDLVYTSYKGSASFDQEKLNRQRISRLKSALPQVRKDNPTWKYIEQSGAKNAEEAKEYFHGFIIHYGADLSYKHLKTFFKPFQTPPKKFMVDTKKGGTFDCENGSQISLPANAIVDANGKPVKGQVVLKFKAFKDPADIVFSGIPMTYNNGGEDMNFSSVGMYDLSASQNGKQLKLNKPVDVDFNCTQKTDGVGFYEMDEKTGKWTKKKDVEYYDPPKLKYRKVSNLDFEGDHFELKSNVYEKFTVTRFNDASWQGIMERFETNQKLNASLEKIDEENKAAQLTIDSRELMQLISEIMIEEKKEEMRRKMEEEMARQKAEQERLRKEREAELERKRKEQEEQRKKMAKLRAEQTRMSSTLLAEGADQGHTYPSLVKGLNSPEFGVYNCDQIYRMEDPKQLSPMYVDESGNEINGKHVTCVMDLNYNGSFSFHPNNIKCSGKGKNVILLFTDNKDVYMLSEQQFARLDLTNNLRPTFKMKNMTGIIKTSDDLKKYLKI